MLQIKSKIHRECYRRVLVVEYGTAEETLNESRGRVGQLIRDTSGATHALSCGTIDMQEALDMMEDFQRLGARRKVAEIA